MVARALVGVELMDKGLETLMAGEVLSAGTTYSSMILVHSGVGRPSSCASTVLR